MTIATEAAACAAPGVPDDIRSAARQAIWRAFVQACREHEAAACYSILMLHEAACDLMNSLP
jgi:hypothetical protein